MKTFLSNFSFINSNVCFLSCFLKPTQRVGYQILGYLSQLRAHILTNLKGHIAYVMFVTRTVKPTLPTTGNHFNIFHDHEGKPVGQRG